MNAKTNGKHPLLDAHPSSAPANGAEDDLLRRIQARYAVAITPHIRTLIEKNPEGPVAQQYTPRKQELQILPEEHPDPIGDEAYSPVEGIVHRYPDRVLFKPVNVCAVYCRYCFRREKIGPQAGALKASARETAYEYIRTHTDIWEVILTGGDPLVLSPRQLSEIITSISAIDHVKVLRIHSRVPIADPARITESVLSALEKARDLAIYVVVHINHSDEITPVVRLALKALRDGGVSLLSQSVLLKGVNDDAEILDTLFRSLISMHVKPYYLHHPDLAPGTAHFRLSIQRGQEIMRALQGRLSGIALPTYTLDIPGGFGKIPLTPSYIEAQESAGYLVRDYQGQCHTYAPSTEKP